MMFLLDCPHSAMFYEDGYYVCTRCYYRRKLTKIEDWPKEKIDALFAFLGRGPDGRGTAPELQRA